MSDDLERRIHEAIDAGEDPQTTLRSDLEGNPRAAQIARELVTLNQWLTGWETPAPSEDALEAMAIRVEQRLNEDLAPLDADPTEPPEFDDVTLAPPSYHDDSHTSGEFALAALAAKASQPPPPSTESLAPSPAELVSLPPAAGSAKAPRAAKSNEGSPMLWLAAAAIIGVVATGGFWFSAQDGASEVVALESSSSQASPPAATLRASEVLNADEAGALGGITAPAETALTETPMPEDELEVATALEVAEEADLPAAESTMMRSSRSERRRRGSPFPMRMEADLAPPEPGGAEPRGQPAPHSAGEAGQMMRSLPSAALARVVASSRARVRACYASAAGATGASVPNAARVRLRVTPEGRVAEVVSVQPSSSCVQNLARGLRFAPPGGAGAVEATLRYDLR